MERWTQEQYKKYLKKQQSKSNHHTAPVGFRTWKGYYRGRVQTIVFHSLKELNRWFYLLQLYKTGEIEGLQRQERFLLEEYQNERNTYYVSDFSYYNEKGIFIVEDVKSEHTRKLQPYRDKKKKFLKLYPDILFKEVM